MTNKTILLSVLMLFSLIIASAQNVSSDKIKPQWLQKPPTPSNSSFRYDIVSAEGGSLDAARKSCLAELISLTGLSRGVIVSSEYHSNEVLSQMWINGKLSEKIDYDATTSISMKDTETKMYIESIDEYWVRDNDGTYTVMKLYAKSGIDTIPLFDNVELTTKYGARGLWRSAIVPGWGQFHKGAKLKGGLILGGTAALVGGIVYTETMRKDYMSKITKTHNAEHKRTYKTRSDNFAMGRNVCIGALGALYVYNLIDAIVTPGARYVKIQKVDRNGNTYAFLPTVTTMGDPAMSMAITF